MNDFAHDSTLVLPAGSVSGITAAPLHVTGTAARTRRTVKLPSHAFDFALAAIVGSVTVGAGVISIINSVAP